MADVKFPLRRPMEPFDTLMYRSEDDPRGRSSMMALFILDRAPEWDRLVEAYERITRLVLPLRQRVVEPPIPVTMPMWVVDPDFDLSYHLRRARLPAPGTHRQLLEFLEPMTMAPLDRARPLWEFTLIEGLEDGSVAWVTKMNHAITDGVGGQELAQLSFDLERDPPPREMPARPIPEDLTPTDLLREAVNRAPVTALSTAVRGAQTAVRVGNRLLRRPGRTVADAAAFVRSLGRVMSGPPAEPSPVMRRRSLRRRLATLEVGIDELKNASKAAGGSLNDGFLAAVCGALRLYHEQLGVPVDTVPMAIPISLRTDDDPAAGNRWAGARLAPPVGEPDPAERIQRIRQMVLEARQEPAINALNLLAPIAVRLPSWALSAAFGGATAMHDLQVSNIPGSPVPLYFVGAEITKTFPFGPLPGPAAMITLYSYVKTCFVGINLDPAAITEPDLFTKCLHGGLDEVLSLGAGGDSGRRSP
jgi:diacylglycerol O-acyltransferase